MPVDEKRKKLIQQLLGEPELFPDSFKSWLSGYLQRDPNIIWERSQIPVLPYDKLNLGGGIRDSDIADGAAIALSKLAAAAYTTYAPAWTSNGVAPALGNGSLSGRYAQIGKQIHAHIDLVPGSTTTYGTGAWLFSLPVSLFATGVGYTGIGRAFDTSTSNSYGLFVVSNSSATVAVFTIASPGVFVGAATPFTWATGDALALDYIYEAA